MRRKSSSNLSLKIGLLILSGALSAAAAEQQPISPVVSAINATGIEILREASQPNANALISPYSIQSALAMAYAGADGETRDEMARVLHYPKDEAVVHRYFAGLRGLLAEVVPQSKSSVQESRRYGATNDPITLVVANRLFGQTGYAFRESYQALVRTNYGAPLEPLDFLGSPRQAAKHINEWVETQTQKRISGLISENALTQDTRLVLVNAMYLKAPWVKQFLNEETKPGPFHVGGGESVDVPTMTRRGELSYAESSEWRAVALPYRGYELLFLIFLPNEQNGLESVQDKLFSDEIAARLRWETREVTLYLPKFKLNPPVLPLGNTLQKLGMKTAFDIPVGTANFDRIAPRQAGDYLAISAVFHKT